MNQFQRSGESSVIAESGNILRELIYATDWQETPIGPMENWPPRLKSTLEVILHAGYPMFVWWGPDLINFYNDAYINVLSKKHPDALGKRAKDIWSVEWNQLEDIIKEVLGGKAFTITEMQAYLVRKGFQEETYWNFSLSPIVKVTGEIGGILGICNESSSIVQQRRRHDCIYDLASLNAEYRTLSSFGEASIDVLMKNWRDVQCAAIYLHQSGSEQFDRFVSCKAPNRDSLFPLEISISDNGWFQHDVIKRVKASGQVVITEYFKHNLNELTSEIGNPVHEMAIVPLLKPGKKDLIGLWLCGVSPHLEMDSAYMNFLTLAAKQISAGLTEIQALEESRQQEDALKESEKRFRELAENVPAIIWVTDAEGKCTYTNETWHKYSGQTPEESQGEGWLESIHPKDNNRCFEIFVHASREQIPFSFNYRLKDRHGDYHWHASTGLPKFDQYGTFLGFVGVVYNIHERKLAEENLGEQEEKLRMAIEATNLGIWDFHPETGVLYWSDTCKQLFGLPLEEEITFERFVDIVYPQDRDFLQERIQTAIQAGEHYEVEYRIIRMSDEKERWMKATGEVYLDEKKVAYRLIGTAQDITERKLAEEQKDDFLRIAGHELRTPLTSVVGYLGLLQRITGEDTQVRSLLDKCLQGTLKMRSLISDFLDISKVERGELSFEMERINFSKVIEETIENINLEPTHHPLEVKIEPDLYIIGDKGRMEQVVVNLLNNAQKYSPRGLTIDLELKSTDVRVLLQIKDKGVGMDQKEVENIFRKFYRGTSGSRAKGIGLGLYIVKKIIDFHQGNILVETLPGKGTKFTVELPLG